MKPIRILSAALFACLVGPYQASAAMPLAPAATFAAPELVEMAQYRGGGRRGAAVGPRGGAIAGRGYAARGPRGAVAGRGYVARGPRGNVVAGRSGAAVVRPGYRPVGPAWTRPGSYWWHPGMAVASGAAIGFATAAAATAYATSQAPAPGYCWYYTNPQRTQGFWDVCPN
ncbi:hypothetical protein [Bosea sp. (in: a-proteobacteria)]|uniref:hypothetical protein n=1 Tax=Bosea sp. (in: a-proteobacteria) TaxID=1871050 RepID=UPI002FCA6822